MTLIPAYGRDYASKKAVQDAFDAGNDFVIADHFSPDDGRVTNREDLLQVAKVKTVNVRYKALRNLVVIEVK